MKKLRQSQEIMGIDGRGSKESKGMSMVACTTREGTCNGRRRKAGMDSRATHGEKFEVRFIEIALREIGSSLHEVGAAKSMHGPCAVGLVSLRRRRKRVLDES